MFPIVSLFVLALLTVFSTDLVSSARHSLEISDLALARLEARNQAESGVALAMAVLAGDTLFTCDHGGESWAQELPCFRSVVEGEGSFTLWYSQLALTEAGGSADQDTILGILDEQSKLHLLAMPPEALNRLPGFPSSLVQVVTSWRLAHFPENQGITDIEVPDLDFFADLAGLDPDMRAWVGSLVTTKGDGKLNINTALPEVVASLGLSDALQDKLERFLAGTDLLRGTKDDGFFPAVDEIAAILSEYATLTATESAEAAWLQTLAPVKVKSDLFRLRSLGLDGSDSGRVTIETLISRPGEGPPRIVEWCES